LVIFSAISSIVIGEAASEEHTVAKSSPMLNLAHSYRPLLGWVGLDLTVMNPSITGSGPHAERRLGSGVAALARGDT
jgi:hypothetical protein